MLGKKEKGKIYNPFGEYADGFFLPNGKTVDKGTRKFNKIMKRWRNERSHQLL